MIATRKGKEDEREATKRGDDKGWVRLGLVGCDDDVGAFGVADDDVVMGVMERLVDSAAKAVAKETEALETLGIEPIELELPLPRITYDEAVELSNGKAEWGS